MQQLQSGELLGVVDVGSNAIRFSMFKVEANLVLVSQYYKRFPISLGAGTFRTGALAKSDMEEATRAFQEIVATAGKHRVIAVATSAVREAGNCAEFLDRVLAESGIELRAISGEEEARLAALGVSASVGGDGEALIFDIGGGSTEVIHVGPDGEVVQSASFPIGAVRLYEDLLRSGEAVMLKDQASRVLADVFGGTSFETFPRPNHAVGLGGTIRSLAEAAFRQGISKGENRFSRSEAEMVMRTMQDTPPAEIAERFGMDDSRAKIIIPGAHILLSLMATMGINEIIVSDAGIREGVAVDYISRHGFRA